MPRVYATPEQLTAWTGQQAPDSADRLLARASADVDAALLTAVYSVTAQGMPTDPDIVAALADATCAQVEFWEATGDDGTGAAGQWGSVSIGPVALSDRLSGPQSPTDVELAPRAHRALNAAGLLPGEVW